jgi:hypothetical protein
MSWEIKFHNEVRDWLLELDSKCRNECDKALTLLMQLGPQLGRPTADHVKGSNVLNLKELRVSCGQGRRIRMLFAFDVQRLAIVLVAGDKKGEWNSWYPKQIRLAELRYLEHLKQLGTAGPRIFPGPKSI